MVGLRADIGYFEHRIPHHLLLQSQVIALLGGLSDRAGRKTAKLGRSAQTRIQGKRNRVGKRCHGVPNVALCGEERRVAGSKCRVGVRKYMVVEETESRPQYRCPTFVEPPRKADSRLEVLFRHGEVTVLQNRWRGIRKVQQIGHLSVD